MLSYFHKNRREKLAMGRINCRKENNIAVLKTATEDRSQVLHCETKSKFQIQRSYQESFTAKLSGSPTPISVKAESRAVTSDQEAMSNINKHMPKSNKYQKPVPEK